MIADSLFKRFDINLRLRSKSHLSAPFLQICVELLISVIHHMMSGVLIV